MSSKQEWVEAGAQAIFENDPECMDALREEAISRWVIEAVEPLIRADERAQSDGMADALDIAKAERDAAKAEVRALLHIRTMIEAEVDRLNIEIGKVVDSRERTRVEVGQKVIDANREAALARAEVAALRALVAEGVEAFRLTKEYVNIPDENGFVLLPDVEGWSHWDWTVKARSVLGEES